MAFRTAEAGSELILLAPASSGNFHPGNLEVFSNVSFDRARKQNLLEAMQRFRGRVALEEGAVTTAKLTADGRHEMPVDGVSWHLLLMRKGAIVGCMRYVAYAASARATDLLIWHGALAKSREWSFSLRAAIERELAEARRRGFHFGEPGGWVIGPELRGTTEAIRLALGGFALATVLGGAVGVCTATRKNHSAAMLRRLGGRPLGFGSATLPSYYEPNYDCEIEILRFDSDSIARNYGSTVHNLSTHLAREVAVIAPRREAESARTVGSVR